MPPLLPNRDGLGPSRATLPEGFAPITAWAYLDYLLRTQRHQHPEDNTTQGKLERFAEGHVRDGHGHILTPNHLLRTGDTLWFYRRPAPETPVPGHLRPIYAGPAVLVVDKPPFLATMPRGRHITQTATTRLRRAVSNDELVPAHRLDRATSGLLMYTTKPQYRGAYQSLWADRKVHKAYEAVAPYDPSIQIGTTYSLGLDKQHGTIQGTFYEPTPERPANAHTVISDITPLTEQEEQDLRTLYQGWGGEVDPRPHAVYTLHPLTGKTHQLRLLMLHLGCPILGDPVYPTILPEITTTDQLIEENWHQPLCLRSVELTWDDPILGRTETVRAPGILHQLLG